MKEVHFQPHINFEDIDGSIIVMDLRRSRYYALNETASECCRQIKIGRNDVLSLKASLMSAFKYDGATASLFVQHFIDECCAADLISFRPSERSEDRSYPSLAPATKFLRLRAWIVLASTSWRLERNGLYPVYRKASTAKLREVKEDAAFLETVLSCFLQAENFFYNRRGASDCLPRSLALYSFLTRCGVPARHCIGGSKYPVFQMHAWVESGGLPVLDDSVKLHGYRPVSVMCNGHREIADVCR